MKDQSHLEEEKDTAADVTPASSSNSNSKFAEALTWPAIAVRDAYLRKRKADIEAEYMGRGDPQTLPDSAEASVRAAVFGKGDRKIAAEFQADDGGRGDEPTVETAIEDMETEADVEAVGVEDRVNRNAVIQLNGSALESPPCADEAG